MSDFGDNENHTVMGKMMVMIRITPFMTANDIWHLLFDPRPPQKAIDGILTRLVADKKLFAERGRDNRLRYAIPNAADGKFARALDRQKVQDLIGLPWIKFPKTPAECATLCELVEEWESIIIVTEELTVDQRVFLSTLKAHLIALQKRFQA